MNENKKLTPMPIWETLLIFAFTTLMGPAAFYWARPALEKSGMSELQAYLSSITIPLALMLLWSLVAFWRENGSFKWTALVKRLRLEKPSRQTILWGIGLSFVMLGAQAIFSSLQAGWIESGLLKIPESIPSYVNPTYQQDFGEIKAQFIAEGVFGMIPFVLFFNIIGEEFLWRGYALPRQELAHGKYAWVLQGLLWTFSHAFQYWLLPQILICALVLTFLSQRQKSTWVGIIGHAINNSLPIIVLALM